MAFMAKSKVHPSLHFGFFEQFEASHPHWMEFLLSFFYVLIVLLISIIFAVLASGDSVLTQNTTPAPKILIESGPVV